MSYPYSMYKEMIKKELGKKYLDKKEATYLSYFSDTSIMSSSKRIYYHGLLYFKRFYPKFLVYFIVRIQVKKVLKKENAPESIQKLYKQIAEIIYLSAMGAYSKGKDVNKAK